MTYGNPVIPGFHPDPSVCRAGSQYYLATSSFTYSPGVPIFESDNLVDWTQIGNVLDRPSQLDLSATVGWTSFGIYAPTLRHHDGRFWMITTNVGSTGATNFFVTADNPAGPWSDPVTVAIPGIDPDLAWDEAGACWIHFSGLGGISRCRIDDATGSLLENPSPTWSGTGLQYPEAPHLFWREGICYLLIAEGGTERGHAVSIARGTSPQGPWESCPSNPILSHRSTDRPIQNTGHADLVAAPDGSWWIVLLGARHRGVTPGFHVLGRETFLAPVTWEDDWPQVGELALEMDRRPPGPIRVAAPPVREEFTGASLHPRWIGVRRHPAEISSLTTRPGWLTLHGSDATTDSPEPVMVLRRQQHHLCRARTEVDPGTSTAAGLVVRIDEETHYDVAVVGNRVVATAKIGPLSRVVGDAPLPPTPLILSMEMDRHVHGPDTVRLGFEGPDGHPHVLAELDGRFLSTECAGGFVGRVLGMYAQGGDASFKWMEYEGME